MFDGNGKLARISTFKFRVRVRVTVLRNWPVRTCHNDA
jgi:hypothetical protein